MRLVDIARAKALRAVLAAGTPDVGEHVLVE
jgi:hypothetical protein